MMGTDIKPIVKKIDDNAQGLKIFQESLMRDASEKEQDILLQFPTVYIHNWKNTDDYEVYIGESNNIMMLVRMKGNGNTNFCFKMRVYML